MAFRVFPAELNAPMRLRPAAFSASIAFDEMAGGTPPTMFLRIAKAKVDDFGPPGGDPPTLRLQAGTGMPVVLTTEGPVAIHNLPDATGVPVATAELFRKPQDVCAVKVVLHAPGSQWHLQIRNSDAVDRLYTWVVADNAAEASQPWLNLPQTVEFGTFVGEPLRMAVAVGNRGTGPLTLFLGGLASGSRFRFMAPLPADIIPNDVGRLMIQFDPPDMPSSTEELYVARSNDTAATASAEHNDRVRLLAMTTVRPPRPPEPPPPPDLVAGRCHKCRCREFQPRHVGRACARDSCGHDIAFHGPPE
jgi:hypothetical protein